MRRLELSAAAIILAMAAALALGTADLPFWSDITPGDRFVPILIASVLALLGVLFAREALERPADESAPWPTGEGARRILLLFPLIVALGFAADRLGFAVAVFCFVFLATFVALRRSILPSILAAAIAAGLIQLVFVVWLGIRLPKGPFGF